MRRLDEEKRGYERAEPGELVKWTQSLIEGKGAAAATDGKNRRQGERDEDEKPNGFKEEVAVTQLAALRRCVRRNATKPKKLVAFPVPPPRAYSIPTTRRTALGRSLFIPNWS